MKTFLLIILISLNSFLSYSQMADYYTTGYHIQTYDSFLEGFSNYNETCYKSNSMKILLNSNKMRIEANDMDQINQNVGEIGSNFTMDILILEDLPLDSGALFHKKISGTLKNNQLNSVNSMMKSLKFKGRLYGHKFSYEDFVTDKSLNGDVFFKIEYENGKKENYQIHISQKTEQQIESDKMTKKMQEDMVEIQNQKNKQVQEQNRIRQEEERLFKAQRAAQNIQDTNNMINQLRSILK